MIKMFPDDGNWYKGNLHMHTSKSDGEVSVEQALDCYEQAGYHFVALTDHWVESEPSTQNGMLLLSGCEWDTGDMVSCTIYHILGIGMEQKTTIKKSNSNLPQNIIDGIREAGGIAILAHPAWSLTDTSAVMKINGLEGCEIYNSISNAEFKNGRRADSSTYVDFWAAHGKDMKCFAGDDSHFYKGEQLRSFIMVKAKELSRDAIIDAIKKGNFYASQGPEFYSVEISEDKVYVKCSKADRILFYSNTVWCYDRSQSGKCGEAIYEIKPTDRYVRIELIDQEGKMAWTSPYYVNEMKK